MKQSAAREILQARDAFELVAEKPPSAMRDLHLDLRRRVLKDVLFKHRAAITAVAIEQLLQDEAAA
jgi:hypothetical protein